MRQHVVHLPGDAFPLDEPGLLDAQPLPLLGLPGALPQRGTSRRCERTNIPDATSTASSTRNVPTDSQ